MPNTITIRNAQVNGALANFSGRPRGPKDREGDRHLLIRLDERLANERADDGWAVKWTKPRPENPDYEPYPYIKVKINYNLRKKPSVYMVTKNNKVLLDENTIDQLEGCYFEKVDVTISRIYYRNYDQWSIVLDIGFFTIEPNELYDEYFGPKEPDFDDEEDIPFN